MRLKLLKCKCWYDFCYSGAQPYEDGGRIWNLLAAGGRFGPARVPQGFLFFTHNAFQSLRDLFSDELTAMEEEITKRGGGRIIFEEDQMRIDFPKN